MMTKVKYNSAVGIRYMKLPKSEKKGNKKVPYFQVYVMLGEQYSDPRVGVNTRIPYHAVYRTEEAFVDSMRQFFCDDEFKIVTYINNNYDELLYLLQVIEAHGCTAKNLFQTYKGDGTPFSVAEQYFIEQLVPYKIE